MCTLICNCCVEEHDLYLGLPLHVGRSKSAKFAFLKDRLTKKLVTWRTKILSAAGKEILIKVVAQAIPTYVMSCYMLPKSLCDDLQLCAQFFWGQTEEKKKIHWRSWDRMCLTKAEGGLGFKNLHAHNLALVAKQGWRLLSNPTSLIARLYKALYFPRCYFLDADIGEVPSFSWRSIMEARPVLQAGVIWKVGSGTNINIWNDNWIPNTHYHTLIPHVDCPYQVVAGLINHSTHYWDVCILQSLFSQEVVESILCIPLSPRCSQDRATWKLERKGVFSTKTAYWVARDFVLGDILSSTSHGDPYAALWKALWNAQVPGKVSICLWRACHNLLPTRERLLTKGYTGDLHCLLCSHQLESAGHLFCDCPTARTILSGAPFSLQVPFTPSFNFKEWMLEQATSLTSGTFAKLLMII